MGPAYVVVVLAFGSLALALGSGSSAAPGSKDAAVCSATNPQECADASAGSDTAKRVTGATEFKDDPAAHALYDQMIAAMRAARTLSWQSEYRWEAKGKEIGHATYRIWMKKPNYARVEASTDGEPRGVLVLDGECFWTYWPKGRPCYPFEDESEWEKTRLTSFMKEAAPPGRHSIAHKTDQLGAGMGMTIIQPSYFHGGGSSLDAYLDGVRSMGSAEKVGDEECDLIEVSFMKHQRSHYLWLSKCDHLPRKLKQIVRVDYDIITDEVWSNVEIDRPVSDDLFRWSPPDGWKEWRLPELEEGILKAGTPAPDLDLARADGSRIKLSDYRGKVVWLYIWRVGCPPCREGMPKLGKLQEQYRDSGLAVIGLNASDDKQIAQSFLRELGITFPNILDASEAAKKTAFSDYQTLEGMSAVPLNYIIDRDGKVADGFYGDDEARGRAALKKLGVE